MSILSNFFGNIFEPAERQPDIQVPTTSTGSSFTQRSPYAPVVPFISGVLPDIQSQFTESPTLFTDSLVPEDSAQTLASRLGLSTLGQASSAQSPIYQDLFNRDLAIARGDITQDPLHLAQTQDIANKARQLTERDKLLAQSQAIDAGQYGLGSTSLAELQQRQAIDRENLTQQQLAQSLRDAETRRVAAQGRLPGLGQNQLDAQFLPASIQRDIGQDVETREAARLADASRLTTQGQQAERAQLAQLASMLANFGGLGQSVSFDNTASGLATVPGKESTGTGSQIVGLLTNLLAQQQKGTSTV